MFTKDIKIRLQLWKLALLNGISVLACMNYLIFYHQALFFLIVMIGKT